MEESKIQALHDVLSKLRRSEGLGASGQYSWSAATKTDANGKLVREDGLPTNALYANFVREGTYDPETAAASKHGDGRIIKRNFDGCLAEGSGYSTSDGGSDDSRARRKLEKKERKKAEKRAAKLEAKRQAKLEEKRRLKREAKRITENAPEEISKEPSPVSSTFSNGCGKEKKGDTTASTKSVIRLAKKTLKRQDSGSMKIKSLAQAVVEKIGNQSDVDSVKKWIKDSEKFRVEGKLVRFVKDEDGRHGANTDRLSKDTGDGVGKTTMNNNNPLTENVKLVETGKVKTQVKKMKKIKNREKKRKRDGENDKEQQLPDPPSFSVVSAVPSSPPPKKRRKREQSSKKKS